MRRLERTYKATAAAVSSPQPNLSPTYTRHCLIKLLAGPLAQTQRKINQFT